MPGQSAGVDLGQADDAVIEQELLQRLLGAPVAELRAELADDKPFHLDVRGLNVLLVDAAVADVGIGHGHDLAFVGWVGQDLLIAHHARIEADLSEPLARGPERLPIEDLAVFQSQDALHGQISSYL